MTERTCCIYHNIIYPWVDDGQCGMAGQGDKPSVCCRNCPDKFYEDNHYFTEEATKEEKKEALKEKK